MALFKFDDNDVFINILEAYPEASFYMASGSVYIDNQPNLSGSFNGYTNGTGIGAKFEGAPVLGVAEGSISLYEKNINRPSGSILTVVRDEGTTDSNGDLYGTNQFGDPIIETVRVSETDATGSLIRPFVFRDGFKNSLKIYENSDYNVLFDSGELVEGSSNLSASISSYIYQESLSRIARVIAGKKTFQPGEGGTDFTGFFTIENTLDKYTFKSPHFKMVTAAPLPVRDLKTAEVAVVSIPSIFYGKKIKPGSVELNYYISGSVVGTLKDRGYNGELIQTFITSSSPEDYSGSVAGIVLYNEGLILLTGSYQLGVDNDISYIDHYGNVLGASINKWTHFGSGGVTGSMAIPPTLASASYEVKFQGTTETPTMMMMAHAKYGELNWSNNPTFVDSTSPYLGAYSSNIYNYTEQDVLVANVTDTQFAEYTPEKKRETYITKVAIYDDKRNLIGIASVANPVRKTEDRQYTFKLKLDL